MVRRRTASPKPSAPVRSSSPSYRAPPPPQARAPAPTPTPMPGDPSQGPGLFGQMAATAGGVAIGSAVGHTIGNMMSGGGGSNSAQEQQPQQYQQQAPQANQPYQQPCEIEWKQFLECSQQTSDLNLCQTYNDLFKQCKSRYGA